MVEHFEAKNCNLDKHEKEMRNGVSSRLLQSEEENNKSDQEEMTSLPTARPSSPNLWKRRRLKHTHDRTNSSNGHIEFKSMKEIILAKLISDETNESLIVRNNDNPSKIVEEEEESEQEEIIPNTSSIKMIKLNSSNSIGQENSPVTQQKTASNIDYNYSDTIKEIHKVLGGLDEFIKSQSIFSQFLSTSPKIILHRRSPESHGDEIYGEEHERKPLPNDNEMNGVLGEISRERYGIYYPIVENIDTELEFLASIFPLRSANDLQIFERLIAQNKDNLKNKLITSFSRLIGPTTGLEKFVTDAWKLTVADSLGRDLNWEGRRDARVQGGKKISVKNSALARMMKIALQSIPRFRDTLSLDADFKKKTNTHFRNSWGRFARANPNHPDVEKWRRLRRSQQESRVSQ